MSQLKRNLTFFDLTMIAIGSVIGSGIFLTPAMIAKALPSPPWILFAWVLGGIMALTGALTYAELASRMPQAGGVYVGQVVSDDVELHLLGLHARCPGP